MTIRSKLLLAFSISTLLVMLIGAFALYRLAVANAYSNRLTEHTVPALVAVQQIRSNLAKYRALQASHVAVKNNTEQAQIEQVMDNLDQQQRALIDEYKRVVNDDNGSEEERDAATWMEAQWATFVKNSNMILLPTSRQHITVTAYSIYSTFEGDYQSLSSTVDALVADTQEELRRQQQANDAIQRQSQVVVIGSTLLALVGSALLWRTFTKSITRGVDGLVQATELVATGTYDRPVDASGRDELAVLARSFNTMQTSLHMAHESLAAQQRALEGRTRELECTLAELRSSEVARDELAETVRSLSSPVLPVMEGVLVVPLTGVIDSQRALLFTEMELAAIEQNSAHTVIVDVTGVPIIDTAVAAALIRAAEAARLLGAETVLVGLRPELAHTIVGLGVDLSRLVTRADLAEGVRYAASRGASRARALNGARSLTPLAAG